MTHTFASVAIVPDASPGSLLAVACLGLLAVILILAVLYKTRIVSSAASFAIAAILSVALIGVRLLFLNYKSNDYEIFLSNWMDFFRANGGLAALGGKVGDYNFPYLYFLALFSMIPVKDLFLIKFLSIFFDILLAYSGMKLVSLGTEKRPILLAAFFTILALPTVFVNSSLWGQCDSIYAAFGLLGLYCGIKDRPLLSVSFAAIAFSFKLQIIFLLPIYAILLIARKIRIRHLAAFPIVYFLAILPALAMGRPISDAIAIYTGQVGTYSAFLTLNAPSVYALFHNNIASSAYSAAGILAAFTAILVLIAYAFARRKRLTDRTIVLFAALLVIFIPFLLPSMHDRYFFLSDILSVVCVFLYPRLSPIAVLTQLSSWSGYQAYLFGGGIGVRTGALLLLCAGVILAVQLVFSFEYGTGYARKARQKTTP